jgi:hypothetical protein
MCLDRLIGASIEDSLKSSRESARSSTKRQRKLVMEWRGMFNGVVEKYRNLFRVVQYTEDVRSSVVNWIVVEISSAWC